MGGEFSYPVAITPDERYGLRLSADNAGRLYLRLVHGQHPLWVSSDQGTNFEPVPAIPAEGTAFSVYSYKVHPAAAAISALERDIVWIYSMATNEWQARSLPRDLHVHDVSLDSLGGLWFAGSVDSRRIPGEETEAAVRYQSGPGAAFEPRSPQLKPLDAVKVIRDGGLAEIRTIDAKSEPVVATSICSWLLDDSSSFVFIFGPTRTYFKRLKEEMICHIDRTQPGALRVFTHQGSIWWYVGNVWKQSSIVAPIVKSLLLSQRQILVRGLAARGEKIAAAVEVSPTGAGDIAQEPEFTAVCISEDGGASFEATQRIAFNDGEILDVELT
jgi:hypothetical protein